MLRQLAYKVNPSSAGKRRNHLLRRNTDRRRRAQPGRNTWPGGQREFRDQEYEVQSAAEAMPADKWIYRPVQGLFKNEKPAFRSTELRTCAEQVSR